MEREQRVRKLSSLAPDPDCMKDVLGIDHNCMRSRNRIMWKCKLGSTADYDGTILKKRALRKIYGLFTKYEVNMGGYWSVYRLRRSWGPERRKKEQGQYQAILTQQAWSI